MIQEKSYDRSNNNHFSNAWHYLTYSNKRNLNFHKSGMSSLKPHKNLIQECQNLIHIEVWAWEATGNLAPLPNCCLISVSPFNYISQISTHTLAQKVWYLFYFPLKEGLVQFSFFSWCSTESVDFTKSNSGSSTQHMPSW